MSLMRVDDFCRRVQGRLRREIRALKEALVAATQPTFAEAAPETLNWRCAFVGASRLSRIQSHSPYHVGLVLHQAENFLAHRFDLLGSGPVVVAHGITCSGLEGLRFPAEAAVTPDRHGNWLRGRINRKNLPEASRIWATIDPAYRPIDWQLDFRSGFRWSERSWHRRIEFGCQPGQDVKVPWELARMQHLPVLALAAHYARHEAAGFRPLEDYGHEVRNQILDFIASNPPGFGVNWACPMDVGIRIANILIACDLLHAAGYELDDSTKAILCTSVRSHARHLAANLEWSPLFRANHYLADIVGLLYCSAYLQRDGESDLWLHFAAHELLSEAERQFHADGGNFEASVCYHRLSGEMLLWGLALLDGLPEEQHTILTTQRDWAGPSPPRRELAPLPMYLIPGTSRMGPVPPSCRELVGGIAAFTRAATRPDGCVTQFGDNDSGRFVVLSGVEQTRSAGDPGNPLWSLDHGGLLNACAAFLGGTPASVEAEILEGISRRTPTGYKEDRQFQLPTIGDEGVWKELHVLLDNCSASSRYRCEFVASSGLTDALSLSAFEDTGFYFMRSSRFYLAIRCGRIGLEGLGAHDHCDQLAIELVVDEIDCVRDPGSYLYTALPEKRDAYRSVTAHHAPRSGDREPADMTRGVFDLRGASVGECLYFGVRGFIGRHAGYGGWIYRCIELQDDRVVILDFSPDGLPVTDPAPRPLAFSSGYGRLSADVFNVLRCDF
jgi:hypothetical protein